MYLKIAICVRHALASKSNFIPCSHRLKAMYGVLAEPMSIVYVQVTSEGLHQVGLNSVELWSELL